MAEIRINKILRQFNIGLDKVVDFLRQQGLDIDYNPNAKVPDEYLPLIEQKFGKDLAFAHSVESTRTKISTILGDYKRSENNKKEALMSRDSKVQSEKKEDEIGPNQPVVFTPKKHTHKRTRVQKPESGFDWGFFGSEDKKDLTETPSDSITPEWEIKLQEVIKEIPGPRTDEENNAILDKVAEFLKMNAEGSETENESDLDLLGDIISAVTSHNEDKLIKLFDVVRGKDIASRREAISELIRNEHIVGDDFWYFVNTLLSFNATLYRKPIADGSLGISDIRHFIPSDENIIVRTSELLFRDKEKVHQATPFFYFYRKRLPAVVRQDIMDNFHYLTELNDINYVFETLGSNTNEQLYLLSSNDSVASMYLGTMLLYNYKNAYGKDAVEALPSFKLFYSELSDNMDTPSGLARAIISKLVLEDNYQLTADEAKAFISDGLESFKAPFDKKKIKDIKSKLKREITLLEGTDVSCSLTNRVKHGYMLHVHGTGFAAMLPERFAAVKIRRGVTYKARVVKVSKNPMLLLLSQKKTQRNEVNAFSMVEVGDILESRFSLYDKRIVPDIQGAGPIYGTLTNIPRNFDYKTKHKVKVTKVTGMASCEIAVVPEA